MSFPTSQYTCDDGGTQRRNKQNHMTLDRIMVKVTRCRFGIACELLAAALSAALREC